MSIFWYPNNVASTLVPKSILSIGLFTEFYSLACSNDQNKVRGAHFRHGVRYNDTADQVLCVSAELCITTLNHNTKWEVKSGCMRLRNTIPISALLTRHMCIFTQKFYTNKYSNPYEPFSVLTS
jgi:hypothetical protein